MQKITYLSLGSNSGDRAAKLNAALADLSALGEVVIVSPFYETEPVEFTNQPWFLNCVIELDTEKSPQELMRGLLEIEKQMGRDREASAPKGPRTIDIDILLYGDQIIDEPGLKIPHPAMHQRRFVLAPLAET